VALQEPVLRAASVRFAWAHAHLFPDVRGALTEVLVATTGAGDNWAWDTIAGAPAVMASNEERRVHGLISTDSLDLVDEHPDTDALSAAAATCVERSLSLLHVTELEAVGASAIWTLAASGTTDAEAALEDWLFSPRLRTTLGPLGGRPDDLVLTARFEADNGVATTFRTEPLTDEQAAAGPWFLSDMEPSEFSPASLYVQADREHRSKSAPSDGPDRAMRVLQQLRAQTEKLLATVGSTDDSTGDSEIQDR
jgi:hypothetical protein